MVIALGLGSNRGDRIDFLNEAIRGLRSLGQIEKISALYGSDALVPSGAPASWNQPYLNMALTLDTSHSPLDLFSEIKSLEASLGRSQSERWAPREIDIDLLAMREGEAFSAERLRIPHAELLNRPFALLPLCDVAPDWVIEEKTVFERSLAWRYRHANDIPFRTQRSPLSLTRLVGIVNITPDSFSDGNLHATPERAIAHALRLADEGAAIIDLGAESTRPGAIPLAPQEEWERLAPVLHGLNDAFERLAFRPKISVDTRHAIVAARSLERGADWINDVSGFQDPSMLEVVAPLTGRLVVMHSLGIPPSKGAVLPLQSHPLDFLNNWAEMKIQELEKKGIYRDRLLIDPGIGFGTTAMQSLDIVKDIARLQTLGVDLFAGHSRKSFLSSVTDQPAANRDLETAVLSAHLALSGVQYVRVHDVSSSRRAIAAALICEGALRCRP